MDHRPAQTIPQAEARYHVGIGEWSLVEVAALRSSRYRPGERTWLLAGAHELREHPSARSNR